MRVIVESLCETWPRSRGRYVRGYFRVGRGIAGDRAPGTHSLAKERIANFSPCSISHRQKVMPN